jgi:hypothetical protein
MKHYGLGRFLIDLLLTVCTGGLNLLYLLFRKLH